MTSLYNKPIIIVFGVIFLAGCATHAPYFRLDSSLQKEMRTFSGIQYVPLVRLCDVYGLDYEWDSFIKKATIQNKSNRIMLRAGSDNVLINGIQKRLDKPVVLEAGAVFVPISFVKNNLGPIIGPAPVERPPVAEIPKKFTLKTIVVDPGHGGRDVGALGRRLRLKEKNMTLSLARKLRDRLEESGIKVIMTRDSDVFVSLSKRADVANRSGADLFVSVHINASRSRALKGFECYYLSETTDDNARALEASENASLKIGEDAAIERSRQLERTLWDMAFTENRRQSSELAGYICDSVNDNLAMSNRSVKSARFYVLKYTRMPSVLVEAFYISNRYEEIRLKDPKFLDKVAQAIAQGILRYKSEYERTGGFTRGRS